MIDQAEMVGLGASRWHIPLLAFLDGRGEARFGELIGRLGLSRSLLSRCLDDLERKGWVRRNPGHGHPLRPEYLLTEAGRPLAAWSARVMAERERLGIEPTGLGRWTLPLVLRLDRGWTRFSALQAELAPISPRALSLSLRKTLEAGLVERRVEEAFPPVPLYGLGGRGRSLARALC